MATGIVKFYDPTRGFGFIATEDSATDTYTHASVISGSGYRYLVAGESVEFERAQGPAGRPRASSVCSIPGRLRGTVKTFDHKRDSASSRRMSQGSDVFMHF